MTIESELHKWWASRPRDQRKKLTEAAQQDQMDGPIVRLLLDTGCPVGPIGTKWESQPEYSWGWPQSVRAFIVAQSDSGAEH
jgi:hypothetical protein